MQRAYFHLWPVWLYYVIYRYLITTRFSERELFKKKCVLISSTTDAFLTLRRIQRDVIKKVQVFMYGPRQILMTLAFLRQIFLKMLKYPLTENIRPVGAELFYADGRTDGQTDRRDEANSRFSQFCESAYK